jgi:hypothetical protein
MRICCDPPCGAALTVDASGPHVQLVAAHLDGTKSQPPTGLPPDEVQRPICRGYEDETIAAIDATTMGAGPSGGAKPGRR